VKPTGDATAKEPHFIISETPHYVGRATAHLAGDPEVSRWNGQSLSSGQLAQVYTLPISMALSPMLGVTSGRYRVNLPMLLDTDNVRVTELLRIAFYLIRDPANLANISSYARY